MIAINSKYYKLDDIKKMIKDSNKEFNVRYKRDICEAYERIKYILFGTPCGCRPVDSNDIRMKANYGVQKILNNYMNLEEQDIGFILDEYDRLSKNI